MVTCPWCGTSYANFQSNCDRCGGPLNPPTDGAPAEAGAPSAAPPPAPRPVSDSYAWKLMATDAWGIVGLIFLLLGGIFTVVGAFLTIIVVTAFVGLPFLVLGLGFLLLGGVLASTSLRQARQTVAVLRVGEAVTGQIA